MILFPDNALCREQESTRPDGCLPAIVQVQKKIPFQIPSPGPGRDSSSQVHHPWPEAERTVSRRRTLSLSPCPGAQERKTFLVLLLFLIRGKRKTGRSVQKKNIFFLRRSSPEIRKDEFLRFPAGGKTSFFVFIPGRAGRPPCLFPCACAGGSPDGRRRKSDGEPLRPQSNSFSGSVHREECRFLRRCPP